MSSRRRPAARRCLLFFPGSRPERYEKALASGADVVCMDLEDSVAPESKAAARENAVGFLREGRWDLDRSVLRINHPSTDAGQQDVEALLALDLRWEDAPLQVMLPKVESPDDVEVVKVRFDVEDVSVSMIPVIETAKGLSSAEGIATSPSVGWLLFGGVDMSLSLGAAMEWEPLLYARSRVVHAAAVGGIDAVDVPFLELSDPEGLEAEALAAKKLGFRGKAAFHPDQVDVVQGVFSPTPSEIEHASKVLEVADREEKGVFMLDGKMVDLPVLEAARRTMILAEAAGL